jgi:SHS2 domain-containing protein
VFTFFDHTGDVGIDIQAGSAGELFADAARAFAETVTDASAIRTDHEILVDLSSPEIDLLLVDWLSELLYRFDAEGFLSAAADVVIHREADRWRLHARVAGEAGASARLPIRVLVKAVTYHALRVEETADGWRARVILDI